MSFFFLPLFQASEGKSPFHGFFFSRLALPVFFKASQKKLTTCVSASSLGADD